MSLRMPSVTLPTHFTIHCALGICMHVMTSSFNLSQLELCCEVVATWLYCVQII